MFNVSNVSIFHQYITVNIRKIEQQLSEECSKTNWKDIFVDVVPHVHQENASSPTWNLTNKPANTLQEFRVYIV